MGGKSGGTDICADTFGGIKVKVEIRKAIKIGERRPIVSTLPDWGHFLSREDAVCKLYHAAQS
jgi:hypothetical protein